MADPSSLEGKLLSRCLNCAVIPFTRTAAFLRGSAGRTSGSRLGGMGVMKGVAIALSPLPSEGWGEEHDAAALLKDH